MIRMNVNSRQLKLYKEKRPLPNQTKLLNQFCCSSLKQKTSFALHKLFITVLRSGWIKCLPLVFDVHFRKIKSSEILKSLL